MAKKFAHPQITQAAELSVIHLSSDPKRNLNLGFQSGY
jgi:hypothetical protein